jgi:hypothetical protein
MTTSSKPPRCGRELVARLVEMSNTGLVTVSGHPDRPASFVATIFSYSDSQIVVRPMDGGKPVKIRMPSKWMSAHDAPDFIMSFDDRGFRIGPTIRVTYLDPDDPFSSRPVDARVAAQGGET